MKQFFLFALFLLGSINIGLANAKPALPKPDFIVIEDDMVNVTADVYMNASSVSIQLLDTGGNVQASATTTPGRTVSFQLNDGSRKVRSTYNLGALGFVVIEDDVVL